jgi:hypothetical protein
MQRITWSGIALHGAPHQNIRRPMAADFAARLFDATRLGLRVIVAPTDVAPIEIAHSVLFQSKPGAGALAADRVAEADEAARKADQARLAAGTAYREATRAMTPVREAENLKLRAEAQLAAAETTLGSAVSAEAKQQAEGAKAQAAARIAELQVQWDAAKAELQPKLDAVTAVREAAAAAEIERAAAAEAARRVARELEPVSVLISRKTQRFYVRQPFEPIFESPVTIADPDRPIGTHVFSAIERSSGDANLRWSVVSSDGGRPPGGTIEPHGGRVRGGSGRDVEPMPTDPDSAKAALDRHSTGRIGSHRRDRAAIFADRHGRGVELGDRQGHGFCGAVERRAARRHQVPAMRSGHRIPLRAPARSPFLFSLAFRVSVFLLVSLFCANRSRRNRSCLVSSFPVRR